MRVFLLAVLLALLTGCGGTKAAPAAEAKTVYVFAMDTAMTLTAYGEGTEDALARAQARITQLDHQFSPTLETSDVYAINHGNGNPVPVGQDTLSLLSLADNLSAVTGGALDLTTLPVVEAWGFLDRNYRVPSDETLHQLLKLVDYREIQLNASAGTVEVPAGAKLSFGAVGKGYAGDQVLEVLRDAGVESALINLGGNVQLLGAKPDGAPWKVAIQAPDDPNAVVGVLEVTDCAVITAGSYERYFEDEKGNRYWHIMDPSTGKPARSGLLSATVVGPEGAVCDGLSTALFVLGPEKAIELWRSMGGFEFILVTDTGSVLVSEALSEHFTPSAERTTTIIPVLD